MADGRVERRWRYRSTWMRESEDGDGEAIEKHLDQWADAGWELVSANAVQYLMVKSAEAPALPGLMAMTYSTAVMRHYFYWRRIVED